MPIDHPELLAVGILGTRSKLRARIESLLYQRRFTTATSWTSLIASSAALLTIAGISGLLPRWIAFAQPLPSIHYEVASVKPSQNGMPVFRSTPDGRIVMGDAPLAMVFASAWNIPFQSSRLNGLPPGLAGTRFDIEIIGRKEDFPPSLSDAELSRRLRFLLQSALIDRFKLKMRTDRKTMPVWAIVVAKGGPKLQRSKVDPATCGASFSAIADTPCHSLRGGQGRGLHGEALDLDDVALFLSNWTDRPTINRSGLTGLYKIDTTGWLRMQPGPAPAEGARAEDGSLVSDLPTLFGLMDSLGLKLESQQALVETYTIEHIEKPDAN